MAARDLVGRPLVPFFDAQENVNESLQVEAHPHEQLDVDARVWDKELGYFVYPSDAPGAGVAHSMPIPIKEPTAPAAQEPASGSFGKLLLTPDMLSRSAPSATGSGAQQLHNTMGMTHVVDHHHAAMPANGGDSRSATPGRSASRSKRSSRSKNRSSTHNRESRNKQQQRNSTTTQQQQQQPSDGGSSGGEDRTASDSSDKAKPKKRNDKKTRNSNNKQPQTPQKAKDGDLSANGKWAWSAFQSSPDPKSLPLPPFVAAGGSSPGMGALPPPMDPPKIEERLDPPLPPLSPGRPPSLPPDAMAALAGQGGPSLPPPHPTSIEHSMTQDLRRMLNIGS